MDVSRWAVLCALCCLLADLQRSFCLQRQASHLLAEVDKATRCVHDLQRLKTQRQSALQLAGLTALQCSSKPTSPRKTGEGLELRVLPASCV